MQLLHRIGEPATFFGLLLLRLKPVHSFPARFSLCQQLGRPLGFAAVSISQHRNCLKDLCPSICYRYLLGGKAQYRYLGRRIPNEMIAWRGAGGIASCRTL
jgi:hypothetical protein